MKFLALIPALLIGAVPARGNTVEPAYSVERGAPYSIRQCPDSDGYFGKYLCYNQEVGQTVSLLGVPVLPVYWEKTKVRQVNCDVPHPGDTVRGVMASTYCPVLGELPKAPFLE
jgi:hypothetical protein